MKRISFLAGLFLFSLATYAQTADEVINKYLTAIGGAEKWKKLESVRQIGSVLAQGMEIPFTSTSARPNLTRQEGDFQGQKFIVAAFDGTVSWQQTPWGTMNKATKNSEEETKEFAKENFEDDLIDYAAKGSTVELEGTEEIEGAKCFKLKIKRKVGDEKIYFIDTDSYTMIMARSFIGVGPMKGQASDMYMSDYKEVEGMMMPHMMEQKIGTQTAMVLKVEKVELNPKLDKAIFSLPVEGGSKN